MMTQIPSQSRDAAISYFKWEGDQSVALPWWLLEGMSKSPPDAGAVECLGDMSLLVYASRSKEFHVEKGDWVIRLYNGSLISLPDADFSLLKGMFQGFLLSRTE